MELTKKQKQLETLNAKIEQFKADNYGYQLTPAKQAKADKMQADVEKLLNSMTEEELDYFGYTDLILERFYNK